MTHFDPGSHVHTVKETDEIRGCVRAWACKRLHRLPDPKHPNAQAGIDTHAVLQAMCAEGPTANVHPESDVGKWARALYPLTPPKCHAEIGQTFELPAEWGLSAPRASFKIDFIREDFSGFGDWKTIKSARYALTPETLPYDLQANLEAFGFCRTFGREAVDIEWLYVEKTTARAWRVAATMTLAQTTAWLKANALPWMRLIEQLRQLAVQPVQTYPHERIACDKGGRGVIYCAHLGACQFRPAPIKTEQLLQLSARK